MAAEHPTVFWQALQDGNAFYKKQQLYSIYDKIPDLDDYIVAGCRYGGPIAMMRDASKMIALENLPSSFSKSEIRVYSSAGEGLLLFSWNQARIVKFGWTFNETLVVLNEEGIYRVYDLQGDYQQYTLGNDATETGVVDARIHDNGMVVMTGGLVFLEVKGWEGSRPVVLANAGLSEPPHSWTVLSPEQTTSRYVEVLLSAESTIYTLDSLECVNQHLSKGPFIHLSASPNGKSLALLTSSGLLWVVSTDFQRSLAEYDTTNSGADGTAKQIEWCGNDAVLVTYSGLALLVGPFGDTLNYIYRGGVYAVGEIDGVRIINSDVCDYVQKVSSSSVSIFKPGSTSPSAILYDAWESLEKRSPKANESLRSIRPDLASAVDECIDAAGREWEPYWQKRLLNAAKFGRAFLDQYNPSDFVNMGHSLRVLNAVRSYDVGIPLTYTQYNFTSPSHLINRLTSRLLHLLALRISEFLSLEPDPVLKHWASAKISKSKNSASNDGNVADSDEELCRLITEKFKTVGGGKVSYAETAKRAWQVGRTVLATKLLDNETQPANQVPLLLEMKEDKLALSKAVHSGDTDLIYQVLFKLNKRMALGSFFRLIDEGGPDLAPAARLLQVYARARNRELLRDFYYSDDRRVDSALLSLEEAREMTDPNAKISAIKAAQKFFSEDKGRAFEAKMMDENVRLLTYQLQLEREVDGRVTFYGLSLSDTIKACIINGMVKRAERLKADFKVPDKRFWYMKLHALTTAKDFEALDVFANSKKSPIGYEPFVHHLLSKAYSKEALSYVAKCDASKRAELYMKCGEWKMAAKECKDKGDKKKLGELKKLAPNATVAQELDKIAATIR